MSAKAGLKKHGKLAEQALMKEFMQLLDLDVFEALKYDTLTEEQRKAALRMVNLIKEKRDHTPENPHLKGRSCANGSTQRPFYTKEETHAPTCSLDAFMTTLLVDALEGRDVAFADVPGAYLHAKMKDFVAMIITGEEVDILCKLKPEWNEFVVGEGKNKRLYVRLNKALYGCVQSALLWYELYSETLEGMGFQINPCDLCVANAVIKGKQCTICWYVDDNKISHVDPTVVDDIIAKIEAKFGKMTVTRNGQEDHNFLGIKVKMDKRLKTVEIDMKQYILNALGLFLEDITRNAATPAKASLFDVRENSPLLSEERAENFHSVTALLLYVSQRCRLDIQTAVSFLTTRVSKPTEDDWSKLRRVLQYLRGTIDDKLVLGGNSIGHMRTWVDASYAIHNDRKSHTGGAISFGRGVLMTKSKKQKLNTKSSTEAEVVAISDYMGEMIWARMFLECQGYDIEENILYQDNESAIKIATNGKLSCGKQSKHIDIRYFFIKDRLSSERIQILHCPTHKMIADFFTKPLQGNLFRFLCDVIMGRKTIQDLEDYVATPAQERVESSISMTDVKRPDAASLSQKRSGATRSKKKKSNEKDMNS